MPIYTKEMEEAVLDALHNDRYLYGENVSKFEEEFARYIGTDHAVAISSGTAALSFILIALKAQGQKWVTSPMSFIASSNCILHAGAKPVFADISNTDYCMDPGNTEAQLKSGAKGMIPVHLFGQPIDFDKFDELSSKYNASIVEDACQAHGAKYKGRKVGSLGIAAAFSFYPSKNMTVLGDGGMITTNDDSIAKISSKLRDSGRVSKYEHDIIGYTARMSSVTAAIGRVQLRHLDEWNARRREIASKYFSRLKGIKELALPPMPDKTFEPVFHQFVIRTKKRDQLKEFLEKHEVESGVHYPIPIHLQPIYRQMYGYKEGMYKNSEAFAKECLSLPMHTGLSDSEVSYICDNIVEFYK